MAEVIGVIASSITISQLTILNGIKTLHTFLSYAKDAPRTIADILQELEPLRDMLIALQVNFLSDESSASSIATMRKCNGERVLVNGPRSRPLYAYSSWQYTLRPTRKVPIESPVFRTCWARDLSEVRRLISQGQASVHDTSPNGRTLLQAMIFCLLIHNLQQIAADRVDPDICHWLIENGADDSAVNIDGETALFRVASTKCDEEGNLMLGWRRTHPSDYHSCRYQTLRELVEFGQSDPLALSVHGYTPLHDFSGPVEQFRYLVKQQQVFDVDLESCQLGLELAQSISIIKTQHTPDNIRLLLGDGPLPTSFIQKGIKDTSQFESTVLGLSAERLIGAFQLSEHLGNELAFISDLIQGGADVHELQNPAATCLDIRLMTWLWRLERNREELILEWLKCLHILKIDVKEFFRKEEELHHESKIVEIKTYRRDVERHFSVIYGPGRDDVTVPVRDRVTKRCDESVIPGAWDAEPGFVETNGLVYFGGIWRTGGLDCFYIWIQHWRLQHGNSWVCGRLIYAMVESGKLACIC
ncbi:uncharacterized protein PAC_08236 [Phialocephala subalpina]|uniref:Fungal N-terminal domain-containing protein n=1 Tax=Phialocephala subalpina TaxID=576137 RepID=A0A1L7WZZ2_9HELO|nr:uncharacterized protein PAC_08236 [Phialocephala subalpina]